MQIDISFSSSAAKINIGILVVVFLTGDTLMMSIRFRLSIFRLWTSFRNLLYKKVNYIIV
jgi:hypothetical protein